MTVSCKSEEQFVNTNSIVRTYRAGPTSIFMDHYFRSRMSIICVYGGVEIPGVGILS